MENMERRLADTLSIWQLFLDEADRCLSLLFGPRGAVGSHISLCQNPTVFSAAPRGGSGVGVGAKTLPQSPDAVLQTCSDSDSAKT